ncbi:MAG: c-type cytochrome domain-containing protein [Xanthomonadales bacterium]|nr:c-type cytochrome domain-containing protein [Xanthomonadales bacterium]
MSFKRPVWDVVTDIEHAAERIEAIESVEVLERPESTILTIRFQGRPVTAMAKVFTACLGFLFVGGMRKALARDLEDIKAAVEDRAICSACPGLETSAMMGLESVQGTSSMGNSPGPGLKALLVWMLVAAVPAAYGQEPSDSVTWSEIELIVSERCVMCHTGEFAPLGLNLQSLEGLLAGSDNGPVVVAGDADGSELIRRIRGESQPRMPMTGPPFLSDEEIALFESWVSSGLQETADGVVVAEAESGEEAASEPDAGPGQDEAAEESTEPGPEVVTGPSNVETVTWRHVAPILATRCAKCHTDQGLMGPAPEGYRLTSYESALSPADRGRVIPGNPDASELVRRIRGQALPRMPFDGPPFLNAEQITLIEKWIAGGAPDATGRTADVPIGAEVRLHGVLGQGWALDGLQLVVPPGTRIDDNPQPGDYVQVRGVIDHRGDVRAERIRLRD